MMGFRKFGTPEPVSEVRDEDPQGINVTAVRRDQERPEAEEIIREGDDQE